MDLLVTGLVVLLGPLMQGLLETQGLTVTGHLEHGLVKVTPGNEGCGGGKVVPCLTWIWRGTPFT